MKKLNRIGSQQTYNFFFSFILYALLSMPCAVPTAWGEPEDSTVEKEKNPRLQGTLDLLPTEKKNSEDPYAGVQDQARDYVALILTTAQNAASKGTTEIIQAPTESVLHFLVAAYYYCSVRAGTCEPVLRALYEAEIMNSRKIKKANCPILTNFWKQWVGDDMEKRLQYSVQTAYINSTSEFKRAVRPKYIKCEESIDAELSLATSDKDYFSKRYEEEGTSLKAILTTQKLLAELKEKVKSVYQSIGLK